MRRKRRNKQKKILLISSLGLLFIMTAGYAAFQTNLSIHAKGNVKFNTECVVGNVWEYEYKDDTIYDFEVPCAGTYKLETWGAQGGNGYSSYLTIGLSSGGYGGYSVGNVNLEGRQKLYVVVGGKGPDTTTDKTNIGVTAGGYNGGGTGRSWDNNNYLVHNGAGGGGATHIATESGLLSSLINKQYSILIVAGGGGGGGGHQGGDNGGNAGGFQGNQGFKQYQELNQGGTQTAGGIAGSVTDPYMDSGVLKGEDGKFGQGGNSYKKGGGAGGGGGYYGGAGGVWNAGGGGSGYIGNALLTDKVMYCYNCAESSDESTKTISTTSMDTKPTSCFPKIGDGYAKITLVSRK